ncbi:MAG: response regulator [Bacteroidales bacterium]|nr:response regulator [Bacteroidales bacterium]
MSKIQSGTIECYLKPTELTNLIHRVEDSVKMKLQPGVILNNVLGSSRYVVNTDPSRITQVLLNLLTNSCKYTTRGAITFGYEIYDDEVYFFCKDTGIGMDEVKKENVNNLFMHDKGFADGSALGLIVSKAVVEKLGGRMWAESRGVGKGSTFWFSIPNVCAELDPEDEAALQAVAEENEEPQMQRHEKTILVAEDNESNYLLFRSMLEQHYNIERAYDGAEAVEKYQAISPDLILMDINMPNMDGYEAVAEIRKLSTDVPIIAVTAYAFVADRQRILNNGFNGYVSKPINETRLQKEIANCL